MKYDTGLGMFKHRGLTNNVKMLHFASTWRGGGYFHRARGRGGIREIDSEIEREKKG